MKTTKPKTKLPNATDSVIAEVRRGKADLRKRFDQGLPAMARDARARQGKSGHHMITK